MKTEAILEIHESLINGQKKQMVEQINEYGYDNFWEDYKKYLMAGWSSDDKVLEYFTDATISYFKIKARS